MRTNISQVEQYLEDLENRIEPQIENELISQWKFFLEGNYKGEIFSPRRQRKAPSRLEWRDISTNDAIRDPVKMIIRQLSGCSNALASGSGAILSVRTDYGTGIMPSIYGAEIFWMDDELNTLPTTWPVKGGADAIERLLDAGPPEIRTGFGKDCLETGELFRQAFSDYPKVSEYIYLYHPDLQGPMDVCELLWGSAIFLDLYDNPDLVHKLLHSITDTYASFMNLWLKIAPPRGNYSAHWGLFMKGQLMIRDDSAMNLSSEMFDEFIRPYNQRLLSEFGGGAIHYCGRGDHYIDRLPLMEGIYAVNLSQPHLNDMDYIFKNTIDCGIPLIGFSRQAAEAYLDKGYNFRGLMHCH